MERVGTVVAAKGLVVAENQSGTRELAQGAR